MPQLESFTLMSETISQWNNFSPALVAALRGVFSLYSHKYHPGFHISYSNQRVPFRPATEEIESSWSEQLSISPV
jgi:hypothetical protein